MMRVVVRDVGRRHCGNLILVLGEPAQLRPQGRPETCAPIMVVRHLTQVGLHRVPER